MLKKITFIMFLLGLILNTTAYAFERNDLYPVKGMCYSPTPSDYKEGAFVYEDSDFAKNDFKALWGTDAEGIGRNDLKVLSEELQINLIRLYDWNPTGKHLDFLNTANELGMKVIVPISNYFIGRIRNNEPDASSLISKIVSEVIVNGKIHPAVAMFAIGNEFDIPYSDPNTGFGGLDVGSTHIAKAAEYVINAQLQAGIALQDIAYVSVPVSYGTLQDPENRPAIKALSAVRSAFAKNSFLHSRDIYRTKYIANVNVFNPGSDLTIFLQETFKNTFPEDYIIFTELGKPVLAPDVTTEAEQAAWVKDQALAAVNSSNSKALGSTIFSYINKNWKGNPEDTYGLNKIALSSPPIYATSSRGEYPVDTLTKKALFSAIQKINTDQPTPKLTVTKDLANSQQDKQKRASSQEYNIAINMDPAGYAGENAEWFLIHYSPQGLSVFDPNNGWLTADAPLIGYIGKLFNIDALVIPGKELSPGFHTFIFGVDLLIDDNLTDSKNWYIDIETIEIQ